MLTAETIDEWATALETTEYKQFRYGITNLDRTAFCCVGIGAIAMGVDPKEIGVGGKSAGLKDSLDCAFVLGIDMENQFFDMNDVAKLTFKEIAALLRSGEYKTWKV